MVIKTFKELSHKERQQMYDFILGFNQHNYFSGCEEMIKMFGSPVYNNGEGHLSLWDDEIIIGTIGAVTKEAGIRGEIFITGLNIREREIGSLHLLLDKIISYCSDVDYRSMKLGIGTNKSYLIPIVEKYGFTEVYKLHILRYEAQNSSLRDITPDRTAFQELNEINKYDFMRVHNIGFLAVPNGAVIEEDEIGEVMEDYKSNPQFSGVYYHDGKAAGIYMLKMEGDTGWIEAIAVAPELRNRGIGKILLKKSIELLDEAGAGTIKLSVMSSNVNAHQLYLKCGFTEENIESVWFERKKY